MAKRDSSAGTGPNKKVKTDYEPTNVLLTGGAGFIASHAVIMFVKKYPQYKMVVLDKMDYCASMNNLNEVSECSNFKFVKGDICSADLINYVIKTEEIDTIIHFAAQTHVDNSFGNSFQFTENNVMGTHVLLESAKVHKIKRFIHVSTDEVYGSVEDDEQRVEASAVEPTNPYAATKAAAEYLVKAYYRSFDLPIIITRGNNVYGPHQFPEKVIPKFISLLAADQPCTIHGDGSNSRHFIHVQDVASAFDTILHKGIVGEIYNIGSHDEITNLELAKELIRLMGKKESTHIKFVEDRPFNDVRYLLSFDKLGKLGWESKITWKDGLQGTIDWYKSVADDYWQVPKADALVAHPRVNFMG